MDGIKAHWTFRERITRLGRRLRGEDRTILLAPDYGASLPLWPGEKVDEDPEEFLPPDLLDRLLNWQEYWDSHHDYQVGWDSKETQTHWESEGTALANDLRTALPPGVNLRVGF